MDKPTNVVTVLITDMEGSTAYTQAQGDEVAMDLLRTHEKIVREVIAAHSGHEIKSMGDGFMITFEEPSDAVACALNVMRSLEGHNGEHPDRPILVRAGMNTGPVIEEGGDIYGTTVNAASRIAAKARSGQVLLSESTHAAASGTDAFRFVDHGLFWLKGLRERWRLFEATTDTARDTAPVTPVGRTPFVNREDERAALRTHVDAALEGRGSLVILTGESGTGKTRLAEEVSAEAEGRGLRLVVGRCYEATRNHPYAPFIDVLEAIEREASPLQFRMILGEVAGEIARLLPHLRRRYPDLPPPAELPPEQEQRYLFTSLREVLAGLARDRTLVIHLDDLQWADESSLLFLEQLAAALSDLPLFIIATYSQVDLATSRPLQAAIDTLQRRRLMQRFSIGPLGEVHVKELVEAVAGRSAPVALVHALHRETDGNPFFIEEVVRHLQERGQLFDANGDWLDPGGIELEVPETVRLTIGRRLTTLSDATRQILTTAAVVGRGFTFDLLEDLANTSEDGLLDALDEAERAGLIASSTEAGLVRFRFAHELIRQTLVADVTLTRRQLLHLRVADSIERVFKDALPDHAADLAYHLTEAGRRADRVRTARALVLAGGRATEAAAYEEAVRHLDRALSLIPTDDPAWRGSVLEKMGTAVRSLGQPDDALATWNEALDAYASCGDDPSIVRLCMDAGVQVAWWMRHGETLELVRRGEGALGDEDAPHRAGFLALRGVVASQRGAYEEANQLLDEALRIARAHDDERILGRVLYSKTAHHFDYVEREKAIRTGRESIEYLRRTGDLWNLANVQGFVGQSLGFSGRFDEAAAVSEGTKDLAERLGNWVAYVYADRARAWAPMARRFDRDLVEASAQRDHDLGERLGYDWLRQVGLTRLSWAKFVAGEWKEAVGLAERSADLERGVGLGHLGRVVLLHAYLGDTRAAADAFEAIRDRFPRPGEPNRFGSWDSFLAAIEGMALIGRHDDVASHRDLADEAAASDRIIRGWDLRLNETVAAIAATCARDFQDAEARFARAVELADTLPFHIEQPEARRFFAWMLMQRREGSDLVRARELLEAAINGYAEIGMPAHRSLARSMVDSL